MRIETVQRPLRELVRSFTTGTILLPQFQRDYVWKPKKIRNLLDSLLHEYRLEASIYGGRREPPSIPNRSTSRAVNKSPAQSSGAI